MKEADPAAVGADTGTSSDASVADNQTTSGPTAVLVISANGTQLYSSADASGSDESSSGNSTDGAGNGTAANTTASGNSTAGANSTAPSGNATGADENATSNESSDQVVVEPGMNITFDASGSEGDNLTFAWTIGNLTFENATFEHAFNETGNVTITLTVTDASNATDEESVNIGVESSGPAPGTPMGERTQTFTPSSGGAGGYFVGLPNCLNSGTASQYSVEWEILGVDENGTAMQAVKLVVLGEHGSAGVARRVTLEDPAGEQLGEGADVTVEGVFLPGIYTITWRLCGPLSGYSNSELHATATYESA